MPDANSHWCHLICFVGRHNRVGPAIYVENLTIGFSLRILARSATTTIIDGGATNTVITVNSGQGTLSALTIQNGYAQAGGSIYNHGTLTIDNSTITQNQATKTGFGNHGGGDLPLILIRAAIGIFFSTGRILVSHSSRRGSGYSV